MADYRGVSLSRLSWKLSYIPRRVKLVDLFLEKRSLSLLYHAIVEAACVCHGAYFAANNAVITSRCQGTHDHFQLYDDNGASLVSL